MRIKILVAGNKGPDTEMLREKGFLVYTCDEAILNSMIDEIRPDVIFINPEHPQEDKSTELYNALLSNMKYAAYPVIYTLSEDDVYLVNRKRTTTKSKRTVIADNIVDGIKAALLHITHTKRNVNTPINKHIPVSYYVNRA